MLLTIYLQVVQAALDGSAQFSVETGATDIIGIISALGTAIAITVIAMITISNSYLSSRTAIIMTIFISIATGKIRT